MEVEHSAQWPTDDPRIATIIEIISQETAVEQTRLVPSASVAELDIASLDMVQAVFAIESHFNIQIPVIAGHDGGEFATVGDLVEEVLKVLESEQPV